MPKSSICARSSRSTTTIIVESLKKTGRLLVVDTAWSMGGVCAEIGCLAAEKAVRRI